MDDSGPLTRLYRWRKTDFICNVCFLESVVNEGGNVLSEQSIKKRETKMRRICRLAFSILEHLLYYIMYIFTELFESIFATIPLLFTVFTKPGLKSHDDLSPSLLGLP